MTITKSDIVEQAFNELRISGLTVNPSPEDNKLALQVLERMAIAWGNQGLLVSWDKSTYITDPDPQDDSGIEDWALEGFAQNLALKLCPAFGKVATRELLGMAMQSKSGLYSAELITQENNPYLPVGAGENAGYWNSFQYNEEPITTGNDGNLTLD
jgi:hypothetical protein